MRDVWGIFVFVRLLVGYMLLFTFSFSFLLSVSDLFSVRVFILALGGVKCFVLGPI